MANTTSTRKYERMNKRFDVRIYSHYSTVPYMAKIEDISENGAFVNTLFLPFENEVITFEIVDRYLRPIHRDNAKVRWVNAINSTKSKGFGMEFENKLPDDLSLNQ